MSGLTVLIIAGFCFVAGMLAGLILAHELRLYRRCRGGTLDFTPSDIDAISKGLGKAAARRRKSA